MLANMKLPKFKDFFSKSLIDGTIIANEHLITFYNACHNIGANDNDNYMNFFINSLEGKAITNFLNFLLRPYLSRKSSIIGSNPLMTNLKAY